MKRILSVVCLFFSTCFTMYAQQVDNGPGWLVVPKTDLQLKVGGYVKFDMIYDMNPIASPDYFDVSKIPTDGSEGTNANLNAKETRLFLDVRKPSKIGDLRAYVEGDFYGSSGAFRLRHAYVEAGNWLAGQTWSNFMDESAIPPTLDFEKPKAYIFIRHAMIRYKHALNEHSYIAFALEQPVASGQAPTGEGGTFETLLPDLTGRYRITQKWGHVQVSAFTALSRFRPDSGDVINNVLYGGNLSGQLNLLQKDHIFFQLAGGSGIGRYNGGLSVEPDENNELQGIMEYALSAGYQHWWSDKFSSFAMFNYGRADFTPAQPLSNIKSLSYAAVNLLWHFIPEAYAGIEYLWGNRTDVSDASGTANRIQFSFQYSFNMK